MSDLFINPILIITGFIMEDLFTVTIIFAIAIISIIYLYIFTRSVEKGTMVKEVPPSYVTEGDWIDKEIRHKGKYVCGPKDLGITKKQIALLKKYKIKKIPVKYGIPFIPCFLLGYITTLVFGNTVTTIIQLII
jgi:hypothetical protein